VGETQPFDNAAMARVEAEGQHTAHTHALVPDDVKRSREGLRAVGASLAILTATAAIQGAIYVLTGSIALLADLIHNAGDALTALPLGLAFFLRSERVERQAGVAVVIAILASALTAIGLAVDRIVHPLAPNHLLALGLAGAVGVAGNAVAARVRTNAGRRLDSPALIADGQHARSDALVSASVIATSIAVAAGATVADPIIGLLIAALILQITWESWRTVRRGRAHSQHEHTQASVRAGDGEALP
jgi:divalent metal cation (Fe/Co/Zn/Cd) transporter